MKFIGLYPAPVGRVGKSRTVSAAGGLLLTETIRVLGLGKSLAEELTRWRKPLTVHDPAKILLDMALAVALGGDCLADIGVLRASPAVYGPVASDPVVSRLFTLLGDNPYQAERQINKARATARAKVWALAGSHAPSHGISATDPLIVDVDATLVTSHSEKEDATPTFKKGFGFHPLCVFADHGPDGSGEPLHIMLRPGNAGSNTATDHIQVVRAALGQLPVRPSKKILVRTDGAGGTREFGSWLTRRQLQYSVGFTLPMDTAQRIGLSPHKHGHDDTHLYVGVC